MKKFILFLCIIFSVMLYGCNTNVDKTNEVNKTESTKVIEGYIFINDNKLYVDRVEFIKDNLEKLKNKNVIVFYVGLGLYSLDEIMMFNFLPTYLYKNIKFFELKGDFNYSKLSFIDKLRVSYGSGKYLLI